MKISVDTEACVASGSCVLACPNLFDQDDLGTVVLLRDSPTPEDEAGARTAAGACPVGAIDLDE